ncbi:MAG TPA: MMPL family transporter [Candidatus Limnocylindria bacterium]|jgi:RND superfamily putative drug exporter|nr:MMPL family transporter [Candidatus Limnocylindria bacterium]
MGPLASWGHFIYRRRWLVLLVSFLAVAASIWSMAAGGTTRNVPFRDTEAGRVSKLIQDEIRPETGVVQTGSSFLLVFTSREGWDAADPRFVEAMRTALSGLKADPRVTSLTTPDAVPPQQAAGLRSKDGKRALANVVVKDNSGIAGTYFPELRALVRSDALDILATGNIPLNHDIDVGLENDLQRAELVSLPLALLLLLLVFGGVAASLLTLGVGVAVIIGGLGATFALARATDVSQYALNIVTLIGLAAAIDYSLFIVSRFREELARGATTENAVAVSLATAGRAVTFSGLTVAIGLTGMLFYPRTFLVSLGLTGSFVVAIAVVYALTFLPAVLSIVGPRVNAWRLPFLGRIRSRGLWHAIATAVMRRPLLVLVPTVAVILLAASPFLQLRIATADATVLPPTVESRRGYDILVREFPGQDQSTITVVARFADGDPLSAAHRAALDDLRAHLAGLRDVIRVDMPLDRRTTGEHIALLFARTALPATSDEARDLVRTIRGQTLQAGMEELLVGGQTAADLDGVAYLIAHTPAAVAFVTLTTAIALFVLLGSVVLPLKALAMNALSISASFGALVWVFQQGHLAEVMNFTPQSIEPTLPVIMFCIVFGLSMDYEVLLLSRIQEEYRRTGDNAAAVAHGLERSGRLITGAAAIMIAVFVAFALADIVIIKSIGVGMAIAVALDATLVRALVVPATMRLLGRANWWAPGPLARFGMRLEPAGATMDG